MKFLRNSFLWIILIASAGLWVYTDSFKKGVCEVPLKYSIGTYDSRFNISKADFKTVVDDAVEIWESSTGKNLFEYEVAPKPPGPIYKYIGHFFVRGNIPVNLIYDERQELSNVNRELVSEINEQKESAEAVRQQFESLQARYKSAVSEYENLKDQYRKRKTSYEALESKRLEVNSLADQINALVKKYNYQIGELNQVVRTVNQTAGQEFEEGQYVLDEKGERINIYEFGTRQDLTRVLAHEFGHALGLDHNDNPASIMYYLNESSNMLPTKEDLAGLSAICKAK